MNEPPNQSTNWTPERMRRQIATLRRDARLHAEKTNQLAAWLGYEDRVSKERHPKWQEAASLEAKLQECDQ